MNRIMTPTADCDLCDRKVQDVYHDDETGLAICDRCYNKQAAPTKGTKQVHRSHAECDHPRTPAARAKCRKARAAAGNDDHFGDTPFQEQDNDELARLITAFEALTEKQKDQAEAVIGTADIDAMTRLRLTLALVERARAKKTTVAKLSKGDVRNIIAIDAL
ncbi:hypothetical protein PP993_gp37 [Gordonia phage Mayweather]|uniref:Uncharacterized protein n=1 Tax=Gordonia phage Mayweather TaxID=2590931 RepID=A0A516KU34_9CAUD|nr:hypothetical protein PP993_gp37 [Gordonia phage Mayweather]QDP45199.1 hypothetical protein SEA_MAYWEATHER_37 [Gordonia phage Mayweather]